jgi:hypothetical protein
MMTSLVVLPGFHKLIEMIVDDPSHFTPQSWGEVVFHRGLDSELIRMEPALTLGIALDSMNMNRLIPLIRVKVGPPSQG